VVDSSGVLCNGLDGIGVGMVNSKVGEIMDTLALKGMWIRRAKHKRHEVLAAFSAACSFVMAIVLVLQ